MIVGGTCECDPYIIYVTKSRRFVIAGKTFVASKWQFMSAT